MKFVAKDEYALTGSIDKVRFHVAFLIDPKPIVLSVVYFFMKVENLLSRVLDLADSQDLAGTGRWKLRLQTHTE